MAAAAAAAPCFSVTTFAGSGKSGYSPDGTAATAALFHGPSVAFPAPFLGNGTVLVADDNYIRTVSPSGVLGTFAGSVHAADCTGAAGDGGAATAACLSNPAFAVLSPDVAAEVLISDSTNHRVRVVVGGAIHTAAGNGTNGAGGDGGPATAAALSGPSGLAFDGNGDLVFADTGNHCLRIVGRFSAVVSTLAGACLTTAWGAGSFADGPATSARFNSPTALAFRPGTDDLYVADRMNHRVRILGSTGIATVIGTGLTGWNGDGAARAVNLREPSGLAWTADGAQLFFTDAQHHVVRMLDAASGAVVTVAGVANAPGYSGDGGNALAAHFNLPTYLAFTNSTRALFVADTYNRVVRTLTMCPFA